MANMKEAIILIRESWKMVSNQTIHNCLKKAGILECAEKKEKIDKLIQKEVSKYTYELDTELKLVNREEFFRISEVRLYRFIDEILLLMAIKKVLTF